MEKAADTRGKKRLAVDIGGTFVDAIELDEATGAVDFKKAPTTPGRAHVGVLSAVTGLGADLPRTEFFIHGTTLGLNAILERRGARTGIITNDGFRDIFLMGRSDVPPDHMYDFQYDRPPSLLRRRHTAGVSGRMNYKGEVLADLDEEALVERARTLIEQEGVEAIAVCFLHSYRNPAHEQRAGEVLRAAFPHVTISLSTDISREYREYERTSTTVLDAYIRPIFERYVNALEQAFSERGFDGRFLIMRSGSGGMTSDAAKQTPIFTVLSGPAGGIVGAAHLASILGVDDLLSMDIGGTSLDACVIERGAAVATHEAQLEHYPLLIPIYDIRTIGAGGGSIAWVHEGLLKVGPQSAGAEPGPICYGRGGTEPTVTDAAVTLGYIDAERFLDGEIPLDAEGARAALEAKIASPLGLSLVEAAAGVFSILLVKTVGALRQITVERGHDPRTFSMLAFGGAGPLVGPFLAREMGIREVIVPHAPAAFSAWGMLHTDLVDDFSRTIMRLLDDIELSQLEEMFTDLETQAAASLTGQGMSPEGLVMVRQLELRYLGQEHTLAMEVGNGLSSREEIVRAFGEMHHARYGHSMEESVEILTLRVRGIGRFGKPELPRLPGGDGNPHRAFMASRRAYCFSCEQMTDFAVYTRNLLKPGDHIAGPAIIDEGTSTTVFFSDQRLHVDDFGHLIVTPTAAGDQPTPSEGGAR